MRLQDRRYDQDSGATLPVPRRERGAALVFSLVAVAIVALLVAGMSSLAVQDFTGATAQRSAEAALNAAEAALNWELSKMSRFAATGAGSVDIHPNVYEGPLANAGAVGVEGAPSIPGQVSVAVRNAAGGATWTPPGDAIVSATGTVNGVSRYLTALCGPVGLLQTYTLYGISALDLDGQIAIRGLVGCAGRLSASVAASLDGTVVFEGYNGNPGMWTGPNPGWDQLIAPVSFSFPTVRQIAARALAILGAPSNDPIAALAAANDNETRIRARDASGALVAVRWTKRTGEALPRNRIDRALFDANDPTTSGQPLRALVLEGRGDLLPNHKQRGSNFYLERLEIPDGRTLEVLNDGSAGYGPVRLWLGPEGSSSDAVWFRFTGGALLVADTDSTRRLEADPVRFVVYNATRRPIEVDRMAAATDAVGNAGLYGSLFAYNADAGGAYGSIELGPQQGVALRGSVVAWSLRKRGAAVDARLSGRTGADTDALGWVHHYAVRLSAEASPPSQARRW